MKNRNWSRKNPLQLVGRSIWVHEKMLSWRLVLKGRNTFISFSERCKYVDKAFTKMSEIRNMKMDHEKPDAGHIYNGNSGWWFFATFLQEFLTLPVLDVSFLFSMLGHISLGKTGNRKGEILGGNKKRGQVHGLPFIIGVWKQKVSKWKRITGARAVVLWCSGLSCCLWHQHPIGVSAEVPAPLLIQLSANVSGKPAEDCLCIWDAATTAR